MIRGWQPASPVPPPRRKPLRLISLLPLALLAVLLFPRAPKKDVQIFPMHEPVQIAAAAEEVSSLPACVQIGLPGDERHILAVPARHLAQGRMLLIDETHPLPAEFVPADTLAILNYTHGRVACRDLTAVSGQDTLDALTELFVAAQNDRIIQLTAFAGTRSAEQQRLLQTDTLASFSRDMPLEEALAAARHAVATADCSEHQTPWAVDIRVCPTWNGAPDPAAYAASPAGRWLTANCWRFGFIIRWPNTAPEAHSCRAWHLRYVGRAHAALMHALNVTFEEYLDLLHRHGTLTLCDENNAPLAAAVCQRAGEHQTSFTLPSAEVEDLSLDNQGWAIASCLFSEGAESP